MKNSSAISLKTNNTPVETEGARRATGVSTDSATQSGGFPDPKVTERLFARNQANTTTWDDNTDAVIHTPA